MEENTNRDTEIHDDQPPDETEDIIETQDGRVEAHLLPPLRAELGVTALAGQVLRLDGLPLEGVTLRVQDKAVQTDSTGRFLLTSISAGHHELLIDGRTANTLHRIYGVFEVGVDVVTSETNALPYPIWMPKIDIAHAVTIPSPTTDELVLTTPRLPGLEVRIPRGTILTDVDGQVVTEVSITPIPVDRPPFALPRGVEVPIYFTVQPGGTYISPRGARLIYPNFTNQAPGARINFWNYDPEERGWYIYGQGTVSPDGKQVIPDPGVTVYEFSGAMINESDPSRTESGTAPPPNPNRKPPGSSSDSDMGGGLPSPEANPEDGEPVDLATGLFVLEKTDLFIPDVLPIALTRTYRPGDNISRPFGIGTTFPYDMFLFSAQQYQEADLVLPDGGRVHYIRISPGVSFEDAEFEHTTTPTAFYKSRIKWNGNGWDLTLKDGLVYVFGDMAPLHAIRDRYGNTTTIVRAERNPLGSPRGNITQVRSPNGRWIEFTYGASNHITQARDNAGRRVSYTYDASGRLSTVTDPNGRVAAYTYDASHRMLTLQDARGIIFLHNEYDASGRIIKQTQADGSTYQFAYTLDTNGKITQTLVTDPRGNIRRVTFNASGYIVTDTRAFGKGEEQTATYEREAETNLVLSVTDGLGRKTGYTYDAMGNVISIIRSAGTLEAIIASFTYEPRFNQIASFTDASVHTITFEYDDKGNVNSVTDPLGNQTTFRFNPAGQPISITNSLGDTFQLTYDRGDLIAMIDPLGRSSQRLTDNLGRLIALANPLGSTTRYAYDIMNLLVEVTDALGQVTAFSYDSNGNLLTIRDARGSITNYAYDNMDRAVIRTDALMRSETYQYDEAGNLTQFTNRKGQVTNLNYDALNRLVKVHWADGATTTYRYDAGNRLTSVVDSVSGTITWTYDSLDRLISENTPQGTVTYTYDIAGRRVSLTVTGQEPVTYSYDNANRLTRVAQGSSIATLDYDAANWRTALTLPNGVRVEYGYDAAAQLTGIIFKQGTAIVGELTYNYDPDRNRIQSDGSFARIGLPNGVSSLSYDAANQLEQVGVISLTHDANGNMVRHGSIQYDYDVRNRLISISGPDLNAEFQYDAFGRRIAKQMNGITTGFLYDVVNPIQELMGGVPTVNVLTGLGVDEVYARSELAETRNFLTDALGSTVALLDPSGTIQTQYIYEPFGKATLIGVESRNPLQFNGRESDDTGLYYYRARYYSPVLQRFISEDPIGFRGGDINFYVYASNNPINLTDPFGQDDSMGFPPSGILCGGGGFGFAGGGLRWGQGGFGGYYLDDLHYGTGRGWSRSAGVLGEAGGEDWGYGGVLDWRKSRTKEHLFLFPVWQGPRLGLSGGLFIGVDDSGISIGPYGEWGFHLTLSQNWSADFGVGLGVYGTVNPIGCPP